MVIQFLCPNGHRIHCADERAGKAAKCPRCGVKFLVPTPGADEPSATAPAEADVPAQNSMPVKTPASFGTSAEESAEPQIEFLCPTGHHLRSPARLQGQPGQCPACGSRFYIPSYDHPGPPHGEVGESSSIRVHEGAPHNASDVPSDSQVPLAMRMAESGKVPEMAMLHPMASLFAELWAEKMAGAAVELHLSDGQDLAPDHFSRQGSQGDHGLFAVREADGSFTVTAVAWASVQRVTVRGLKQLPEGFGEP